jgi:hypothetical protein
VRKPAPVLVVAVAAAVALGVALISAPADANQGKKPPPTAGQKATWIADARSAVKLSFPSIAAFLWFDSQAAGLDWRIDSSPTSLSAFKALALDRYFHARP